MDRYTLLAYEHQLQDNWHYWPDLERGTAVVRLINAGVSKRRLGKIAGCSEGLIRYIEIVGRLPLAWKQLLEKGHSTRSVVDAWRAELRKLQ